jgi:hypothetical protein
MSTIESIKAKFDALAPHLNERLIRLWAGCEAKGIGRGGITQVSKATGLSPKTIRTGIQEIEEEIETSLERRRSLSKIRRVGGGRKRLVDTDSTLVTDLEALIDPQPQGHLKTPLRWTCKSTTKLAEELKTKGHSISPRKVADLLYQLNYNLQSNCKITRENLHPDRNAQFQYIHDSVLSFQARSQPVIFIDIKKQEVIGECETQGRDSDLSQVKNLGYRIYNLSVNCEWGNVTIDYETTAFAVNFICQWWCNIGQQLFSNAGELLIIATRSRHNHHQELWKTELQKFVNESGLTVHLVHFPSGTTKWNLIEHSIFCHVIQSKRGTSKTCTEVVINLIGTTTPDETLTIQAQLDQQKYRKGLTMNYEKLSNVNLHKSDFYGDWNYAILPSNKVF